ncbi:MAG: hypothetical protein INR63_00110 [Actinomycetospora chiangmaiensis]|nr:hypothetical protein [Actinomycetospora chiangmaiensis]
MTIRTKLAWNDAPSTHPAGDPGRGRRQRRRPAARKARARTMGRLAPPAAVRPPLVADARTVWDEPPLPLLLDGDFDHDDGGATTLALRLHLAIRDEEDGWSIA